MRKILFILTMLVSFSLNAEELNNVEKTSGAVFGLSYHWANNNDDAFLGLDIKLKEKVNSLIIGFDVSLMKGLESSEEFDFGSFRPSVGFYAWGDKSSNFKIIMSASSGLSITSLDEKNHTGTMSSLEIDFIYSIYGLVFGVSSINNPVYTNNIGQVGFRIWL